MLVVPVKAVPNQSLQCTLNGQAVQLNIRQVSTGLYMDVLVNNALIIGGVICQNLNRIVRSLYLGFQGDFMWIDNLGNADPMYQGLGTQFTLLYILPDELPAGQG